MGASSKSRKMAVRTNDPAPTGSPARKGAEGLVAGPLLHAQIGMVLALTRFEAKDMR